MGCSDTLFGFEDEKVGEGDGKRFAVLKAELGFIFASFASKVPLLALFWYSTANTDFGAPEFDGGAGAIVGAGFGLSTIGVVYFTCLRGRNNSGGETISIRELRMYHFVAGVVQTLLAIAMFGYIGNPDNKVFDGERSYGNVINTFSVWTETAPDTFSITAGSEDLGGGQSGSPGVALPALPPAFGMISGIQHLISSKILKRRLLFDTFRGAWFPRIIDYALSTPLIFLTNMYFFDTDITLFSIVLVFAAFGLLMFCGYASEVAWYASLGDVPVYAPFVAGSIYFLLTWIPLGFQLEASVRVSTAETPWFVYAFTAWVFSSFCFFPVITLKKVTARAPKAEKEENEMSLLAPANRIFGLFK
jgi:hypothetical protein